MKNNIVIIGAGGHGRVVADSARLSGYENVLFLDDAEKCAVELAGKTCDYIEYIDNYDFFVAIGNSAIRKKITNTLADGGANIVSIIHPSAIIGSNVTIGIGTFVAPGAVINTGTSVGRGVIINTCASVDHDCVIGDFCHISVGARIAGTVEIGPDTFLCAGSTVINNHSICAGCIIGAGAVVIKNIVEPGAYVGVPAVRIK